MNLVSTRDHDKKPLGYSEVLLAGLAPDGGLYVPTRYPQVDSIRLAALKDKPYTEVAYFVKQMLVGRDIPGEKLQNFIDEAYGAENFPETTGGNVTPVREIGPQLYLQNLSLGPTAAFKDMAMQLLGREMNFELERQDRHLRILGATSGDTGSAAEAAMKGLKRLKLFMLSPEEGMSSFQKAQMGSFSGGNIFNISIKSRFDDCQDLVKRIKMDDEFSDLGAVNSINWGRISSQVPYYFSGYLQVAKEVGDPVDFVVPSGNFGNVLSGYIAKQMGLPIRKLIVATNENDVLHRLFTTGVYETKPATVTSSPSMDISKASNYERLVFDIFEGDVKKVVDYMQTFSRTGMVDLRDFGVHEGVFADRGFVSGASSEESRIDIIKATYLQSGIVIDPHTADGVSVAHHYLQPEEGIPMVCLETALPVKFEDTIKKALDIVPERPTRFKNIESKIKSDAFVVMEPKPEVLKDYIRNHSTG